MSQATTYATTEEAVEALLTHVCRNDPGLRLNPRHCLLRIAKAGGKMTGTNPSVAGCSPFWYCQGCQGPVLPGEFKPRIERKSTGSGGFVKRISKQEAPTCGDGPSSPIKQCRYKGHGQFLPADTDHFYRNSRGSGGLSSWCIDCQREHNRILAARRKKGGSQK